MQRREGEQHYVFIDRFSLALLRRLASFRTDERESSARATFDDPARMSCIYVHCPDLSLLLQAVLHVRAKCS